MSEVTRLLEAAHRGDRQAAADLLPMVYDELRKLAAAGLLDEDAPDRLGRRREEMALSLESLVADKPEERLVHQRRRVERLPGLLAGESRRRELAQLVVDHGQQIGRRLTIASVRGFEQSCDLEIGRASCRERV